VTAVATPGLISTPQHLDYSSISPDSPATQGEPIYLYLGWDGTDQTCRCHRRGSAFQPYGRGHDTNGSQDRRKAGGDTVCRLKSRVGRVVPDYFTVPTGLPSGNLPIVITQNGVMANLVKLPVK